MSHLAIKVSYIFVAFLLAIGASCLASCANESALDSEYESSLARTEHEANVSASSGMQSQAMNSGTEELIVGVWKTTGVMMDGKMIPNVRLEEDYSYAGTQINLREDMTCLFQRGNIRDIGGWQYYGKEGNQLRIAIKIENTLYYGIVVLGETNYLFLKNENNELEDPMPIMVKKITLAPRDYQTQEGSRLSESQKTRGEENASIRASRYLEITAFSFDGLVEQLEYEGFSYSEAVYGAEHCGSDWNEQAAKKAKAYLNIMSFSRSELIEQLEYEGFTRNQAEYGVAKEYY